MAGGNTWVQVASAPLGAGLSARFRAGRGWPPGELDAQPPVLVDEAVLAELEGDGMLRVRRLDKAPKGAAEDAEVLHLPTRLPVDLGAAAQDRAKALKAENEAMQAQLDLEKLETENARLKEALAAKASGEPMPKKKAAVEDKPEGKKA